MRLLLLIIINFILSISLGSFLSSVVQVAIIQLVIEPIISIGLALLATRSPIFAPIIVYVSGLLFTISYSLYNYGKFSTYKGLADIFTDLAFITAIITLIVTSIVYYSKKTIIKA